VLLDVFADSPVRKYLFTIGHAVNTTDHVNLVDVFERDSGVVVGDGVVLTVAEPSCEGIDFFGKQLSHIFHSCCLH
jgi:hypothetical protein